MWVSDRHPNRDQLLGRGQPAEAPAPSGLLLGSFPRRSPDGVETELRVTLEEYEGRPFTRLHVWQRSADGQYWPMKGRGLSVRMGEIEAVREALARALVRGGEPAPEMPEREVVPKGRRERRVEPRRAWSDRGSPLAPSGEPLEDAY